MMAQQLAEPLHDGKAKTQAPAAFVVGVVDLVILFKNLLQLVRRDADAGIPDFDPQHFALGAATNQDTAFFRVFERVRQQVADHLPKQPWVR